ncbi:hypothetical protein DRJ25_00485 [Candidatus Woesearchaeota archaeon]|nr:MAG: hypothetical protein DRJ25_00485 [Candidatus Woesearchaeota archaeon]
MLNKTEFKTLRKQMEAFDEAREQAIRKSRDLLRNSKSAIYSTHRKDYKSTEECLKKARKTITEIENLIKKEPALTQVGAITDALEEYTEAECYYSFVKENKIPTIKELKVTPEVYIAGLSDMTGELVRKAINAAINGDYKTSIKIKEFVEELYSELMLFEFKGQLRKKFDSIKYGLEKVEELVLQIKMKKLNR